MDSLLVTLTTGIVGLPNTGRSTLLNTLTRSDVLAANYPFTTIESDVDVMGAPNSRLPMLTKMFGSQRIMPVTVGSVDIVGIVRGASKGEGMGSAFLANVHKTDAICQVTRVFEDIDVTHVNGKVNPAGDIDTITAELILADLQSLEKALPRVKKEARIKKESRPKLEAMQAVVEVLESGKQIHGPGLDMELLRDLFLLTTKPFLYVFNCDQDELADEDLRDRIRRVVTPAEAIFLGAKFKTGLVEMDEEEGRAFLEKMEIAEPGLDVLARVGYETLGLQSYLVAGPKEARAWTIPRGATAPEAVGVIHTDFQKGFIKARVVSFDDLMAVGSGAAAEAAGKIRLKGKDYIIQDGDVVESRVGLMSKRQTEAYFRTPERLARL